MVDHDVDVDTGVVGGYHVVLIVGKVVCGTGAAAVAGKVRPEVEVAGGKHVVSSAGDRAEASEIHVESLGLHIGVGSGESGYAGGAGPAGR